MAFANCKTREREREIPVVMETLGEDGGVVVVVVVHEGAMADRVLRCLRLLLSEDL